MKKLLNLTFLVKDNELCLAMKKRGFGEGNWNGFGGKVEEGETMLESVVREVREESGVEVAEDALEEVACIEFHFEDGKHLEVHTYFACVWKGEPIETEEMKPEWFSFDAIPYDAMWADDIHWLPRVLKGEKVQGVVYFSADGKTIEKMEWKSATELWEASHEVKKQFPLR